MRKYTHIPDKKGQLNGILSMLITGGILLTIIVITIAIGAEITTDIRDANNADGDNSSLAFNVSNEGLAGLGNLSGQFGLIGTVIALTVVLLILVTLLFRQFGGGIR